MRAGNREQKTYLGICFIHRIQTPLMSIFGRTAPGSDGREPLLRVYFLWRAGVSQAPISPRWEFLTAKNDSPAAAQPGVQTATWIVIDASREAIVIEAVGLKAIVKSERFPHGMRAWSLEFFCVLFGQLVTRYCKQLVLPFLHFGYHTRSRAALSVDVSLRVWLNLFHLASSDS